MKIVFMGTPEFAADILEQLGLHHDVVCVYTRPDKVRGRGKKLLASPVKSMAEHLGIEVRTPRTLKDDAEVSYLRELSPDAICVAAYGMILPKAVLNIPVHGCLNVHASLLPRWRGAAPIERAILEGDEYAGVCIMRMEEGLDTGDWCVYRKIEIAGLSSKELSGELSSLGASALLSALEQCASGHISWTRQNAEEATYAPKIEKAELWLDPKGSAVKEQRKVLASSTSHPSKAKLGDRICTICESNLLDPQELEELGQEFGQGDLLVSGKRILLCFDDGAIEVSSLKPDGKQEMDAASFLAGARLPECSSWQKP